MKKLWLLAALAASGACGGDSISIDALDEEYADAFCGKIYECCNDAEAMQFGMLLGFTDETSCRTSAQMDLEMSFNEQKPGIEAGTTKYDGGAAADCVSQINGASCAQFLTTGASACQKVFRGSAANGTTCEDDEECSSTYCDYSADPQLETGMCNSVPGNGQPCDFRCADGLSCINMVCGDPKNDGETCEFNDECKSGNCEGTCLAQTVCDGNDTN